MKDDGTVPSLTMTVKPLFPYYPAVNFDGVTPSLTREKASIVSTTTANANAVSTFLASNDSIVSSQKLHVRAISSALAATKRDGRAPQSLQ